METEYDTIYEKREAILSVIIFVFMWLCTLLQVLNIVVLTFIVITFYYKIQTILRAFWFLTKSQVNDKIARIQRFYNQVFFKQLLVPKKKIQRLLDPNHETPTDQKMKESINEGDSGSARNSFIDRRVSNQASEAPAKDSKEVSKRYKRTLKDTPPQKLLSATAVKLVLKFSWRLILIVALNLLGNLLLFNYTSIVKSAIDFHRNFVQMAASTVNMNSMASHNFAPYSNTTFINQQYVKSRGIAAKNFYNFLGLLEDSTVMMFFQRIDGIYKISHDIEILQLRNYNQALSYDKPSLFYLRDANPSAELIRDSLNFSIISSIQQGVASIINLGFKTAFLTNLNFNDYLLIYYGKLPKTEESFDHIENHLNQLILANMNMFDYIMSIFYEAYSKSLEISYFLMVLFMLVFLIIFVILMKQQLTRYLKDIPREFFYCQNIINLFHFDEISENKVLEKFFIEEILPSLKQ